ncbi:MAG: PQQ-dependent sugar dehydrogenase [Caulobacterales bacterium]
MGRMILAACVAATLAACTAKPADQVAEAESPKADAAKYQVAAVAEGLSFPWSIAFLPDGSMLVTEKEGRLRVIRDGKLLAEPVRGVPPVLFDGQGGLFQVSLHPRFAENNWIYLTYAAGTEGANATRLTRATFKDAALSDVTALFSAQPAKSGTAHYGGRIAWLPDETLLLTLGDGFSYRTKAQALDSDLGKIVRLRDDGTPAPDNPFVSKAGARPEIYTLGHRNVQGIARDSVSGAIYAHEHGPMGGDEINLIQAGRNYGWPIITYGRDYTGAQISPFTARAGLEQPLVYWVPSIAPSGMTIVTKDLFPAWKGDLLVSALAGMQVRRVHLQGGKVESQEVLFGELGERIRDVAEAPDGSLYLLTDSAEGKVLRVTPKP